ncbi:hypothetical protein [Tessaracoccus antarcticus]|uniref:Uncharacterized protein n=1 Tax=Tessaracoccus antarcticus TaxID=2479848 RepID=A0A3M0G2B8_9ACTN|nr:hypothetical protein [Tessaracoccus antarcticus]RMB58915.1 hypothetical protein EAX62_12455 [Tessaracoccus antarcticus]
MTTTLANTVRSTSRSSVPTTAGARTSRRPAPLARPEFGGPTAASPARTATRRPAVAASCHVTSPALRRAGLILKLKVAVVAAVALVGVGVSTAEFATWTQADPSVEFVAGDPAWAHVTGP